MRADAKMDDLHHEIENAWSKAIKARRLMHYLMTDLEFGLDNERGQIDEDGTGVVLRFQVEGNEDTKWLASEAWAAAKDTEELMQKLLEVLDAG